MLFGRLYLIDKEKDDSRMSEQKVVSIKKLDSAMRKKVYSDYLLKIQETELLIEAARFNMKQIETLRKINQHRTNSDIRQSITMRLREKVMK